MNILVFSWRDPKHPLAGGAEQVMHEHMKGWVDAGHGVTLFASRFKGAKEEEVLDRVEIVRKGSDILGVQIAAFFWYLFGRHKKYDFVVDQFHGLPFFTPLYIRLPKLAVIQEIARDVWFVNRLPHPFKLVVGTLGYLGEPLVFLFYKNAVFMTGSNSAKKNVSEFGGIPLKNICVVPHGVIIKKPYPVPKKEKKFTIVFLGIHSKDKGIEDALECFSLLKQKGKYNFWTIGKFESSEYGKHLRRLVDKLGLKRDVKFWGYVTLEKKFELLARAHVLINPSIHEGWGLVNIEANSVGVPVVAYKSPGLMDSVKENLSGVFVDKNSPRDLAEKVGLIQIAPAFLTKLQEGACKWSQKFSWKYSQRESLNLIEKIRSN